MKRHFSLMTFCLGVTLLAFVNFSFHSAVAQKKLEPRLGSLSESNPTMKVSKDSVYLLEPPDSKFSAFVFNIFKSYVQVSNSEIKESTIVFFIAPPALFDYKLVIGPGFTEED